MKMKILKTRSLPIGIDIGSAYVKVVQFQQNEDKLELIAAARMSIPVQCRDDSDKKMDLLAEFLRGILKEQGFRGKRCIISIPASETFLQHIKTARVSPDRLNDTLRWELQGKLPFDTNDAIIRHIVVGEVHNEREIGLEVIVVAVQRETVDRYLKMASDSKLDVIGINVEPCAILECFGRFLRRQEDRQRATLFLDLGRSSTQVVISHGSKMVFARNIMFGADRIDAAAASALNMSLEDIGILREKCLVSNEKAGPDCEVFYDAIGEVIEEEVREIKKSLQYYDSIFPTKPVQRAIFLGGQAMDKQFCQMIAKRLNLPSQIGDPFVRTAIAAENKEVDVLQTRPMWAVAVGLSVGEKVKNVA